MFEGFRETAGILRSKARRISVFAGMDGFVDEIVHVVDKRQDWENYTRLMTIKAFGERIMGAAGLSANMELVPVQTKLGGNGPIFSNALHGLGADVVYAGCLGKPEIHPVFKEFAEKCEVYSLCEPGYTDALEFGDGKLMFGKHKSLSGVNWAAMKDAFGGADNLRAKIADAELAGMTNWTMLPLMNGIWEGLQNEVLPALAKKDVKPVLFFDLADPEKRKRQDIMSALSLIEKFGEHFRVVLGLNEKEAYQIADVLDVGNGFNRSADGVDDRTRMETLLDGIYERMSIYCLVVHPVKCAAARTADRFFFTYGPYAEKPLLTTGAGDNFNAGFCYALVCGLDVLSSLRTGVSASGYYVRNAKSPALDELCGYMDNL